MLATFALGAEGVQIGTRFALTEESSAHENFKQLCLNLNEGDTKLLLKKLSPTRLVKGEFTTAVEEAEARGASAEEMKELLGKGRSKKGIFEGNLQEGELEIGQVASLFREMQTVSEVMKEIMEDFRKGWKRYNWRYRSGTKVFFNVTSALSSAEVTVPFVIDFSLMFGYNRFIR